jgi:hypothetical protein
MRGETQAHLFLGDDGQHYVVKLANNPIGSRTLINEVICSSILHAIGIRVPQIAYMRIPDELAQLRDVGIITDCRIDRPASIRHFASALPCDPRYCSIYDFVPKTVASRIENAEDFLGVFVADRWISNIDVRQAVYSRSAEGCWQATFIDHGYCFGGEQWELYNSPAIRPSAEQRYHLQNATEDGWQRWVEKIRALPDGLLDNIVQQLPAEWMTAADTLALRQLLTVLERRRGFLPDLVRQALIYAKTEYRIFRRRTNLFPNALPSTPSNATSS